MAMGTAIERSQASAWTPPATATHPTKGSADTEGFSASDLEAYVSHALSHSPRARADFHRWQSAHSGISGAGRLPNPSLSATVFVSAVETRVGPQRARLAVTQAMPWPGVLKSKRKAASANAQALQSRWEASLLELRARVHEAYWRLWLVRRLQVIHIEHRPILRSLSETVAARMAVGDAGLADLQWVDLAAARHNDLIAGLAEGHTRALAELRGLLTAPPDAKLPTPRHPEIYELSESQADLTADIDHHPLLEVAAQRASAAEASARATNAQRGPGFRLGIEWIITGAARMPDVLDDGRDALAIHAGLELPLWQRGYRKDVQSHQASAAAQRAEREAMLWSVRTQIESELARLRDSARKIELHEHTLIPQARAAYASVLGAYASGRAQVAQALEIQRELLQLRIALDSLRAEHAQHWAQLEALVGRPVHSRPAGMTRTGEGNSN